MSKQNDSGEVRHLALTVPEAAAELRVSESTMWDWVKTGRVKSSLLAPKVRRIMRAELEDFMLRGEAPVPDSDVA